MDTDESEISGTVAEGGRVVTKELAVGDVMFHAEPPVPELSIPLRPKRDEASRFVPDMVGKSKLVGSDERMEVMNELPVEGAMLMVNRVVPGLVVVLEDDPDAAD